MLHQELPNGLSLKVCERLGKQKISVNTDIRSDGKFAAFLKTRRRNFNRTVPCRSETDEDIVYRLSPVNLYNCHRKETEENDQMRRAHCRSAQTD